MTHKEKMNRYFAFTVLAVILGTLIKTIGSSF